MGNCRTQKNGRGKSSYMCMIKGFGKYRVGAHNHMKG
jgi:hypothetical protein